MAEVEKSAQTAVPTGVTPTFIAAETEDTILIPNDGSVILEVRNTGEEDCKVTIKTPGTEGGLAIADQEVTVPKESGVKVIGPFKRSLYNNSDEQLEVTFSKETGVTYAIVKVP